jgi:hypothetical protein
MTTKRMTADERDEIVRLRLNAVPVRAVAQQVGCNKDTVTSVFNAWLDETTDERREQLERERSRVITRLAAIADDARRKASDIGARRGSDDTSDADLWVAESRYMHAERQAWKDLATVAGLNAPTQIAMAGGFQMPTEAEAAAILAELDQLSEPGDDGES